MDVEAGSSVAGRYRLERLLVDGRPGGGAVTLWQGRDDVLDRSVAVRLLAAGHPRTHDVLDAARSTAVVDDRRIARVLDAAVDPASGHAHIVTAWAPGSDLVRALADGPLDAADALALVAEVADAVTAAHRAGLAHGALDPTNVVVDGADVTVLGLAVDTALWGTGPQQGDPARVDAEGLGALLYACLTARWPYPVGATDHHLPDAPRVGGRLAAPRQVRAAVPSGADTLCLRALGIAPMDQPIADPAEFAATVRELQDAGGRRWSPTGWWRRGTGRATAQR